MTDRKGVGHVLASPVYTASTQLLAPRCRLATIGTEASRSSNQRRRGVIQDPDIQHLAHLAVGALALAAEGSLVIDYQGYGQAAGRIRKHSFSAALSSESPPSLQIRSRWEIDARVIPRMRNTAREYTVGVVHD